MVWGLDSFSSLDGMRHVMQKRTDLADRLAETGAFRRAAMKLKQ
jgi:hypothetical protein